MNTYKLPRGVEDCVKGTCNSDMCIRCWRRVTNKNVKMKYLFLDIDGVVNCKDTHKKGVHFPIDQYMAFLVGKIQMETDCAVVLSSSWRHLPDGVEEINKRIVNIYDKTGSSSNGIRGIEIHEWLNKNVEDFNSGSYKLDSDLRIAILDDESDMLLWQAPHFFQTSWEVGLTEDIANKIISHLNR